VKRKTDSNFYVRESLAEVFEKFKLDYDLKRGDYCQFNKNAYRVLINDYLFSDDYFFLLIGCKIFLYLPKPNQQPKTTFVGVLLLLVKIYRKNNAT
jgi:hypothetical protein